MGLNDWSRAMLLSSHPTHSPIFSGGSLLAPFIRTPPPPPPPHQDFQTPSPPNSPNLNHPPPNLKHHPPNKPPHHTAKDGGVYRSGRGRPTRCNAAPTGPPGPRYSGGTTGWVQYRRAPSYSIVAETARKSP
ncbi:hypothetical protein NPIL_607971 [Nephila pilipes]|uniref:Uncharacterized protein n=1 Tax=Nephila pilipes TaxID=299642 RepID=A0A8X6PNC9_NEPPI|nr:hypothetical protein NPIL_607971 [Nephila pilipes]